MPDDAPPDDPKPAKAKGKTARPKSPAGTPDKPKRRAPVTVNRLFKLLILINCGLCLLSLVVLALTALFAPKDMTDAQRVLMMASYGGFTSTLGAFIGLLGGRAAAPDQVQTRKRKGPDGGPTT